MKKRVLQYLSCALCKSELILKESRKWKDEIRSGKLVCSNCQAVYPIICGRPVLLADSAVNEWKSPVSEVLGISKYETYEDSIATLSKIGIKNAIKTAHTVQSQQQKPTESIKTIPSEIRGKIKYRASGEWFKYGNRKERLLTFPWETGNADCSFKAFMEAIQKTQPEVLLDIASGGGFAVSQQVYLNNTVKQTIAVERDLKCLGNIQYRFKHIDKEKTSEAIAGDVRHLPILSASIDTVMMLMGLPEISGITSVLKETHRVLKPTGNFVMLIPEAAYVSDKINKDDFTHFASKVDLYAGYEKFMSDAKITGFEIKQAKQFKEKNGKYRRLILLKRK